MHGYLKTAVGIMGGILLMTAPPVWAKSSGSQAGGLPALAKRVTALEGQNNWVDVDPSAVSNPVQQFSSAGPVTVESVGTGEWEVTFSKDVHGCSYQATIGNPGNAGTEPTLPLAAGFASAAGDTDADSPNDVTVNTFDTTGAEANLPFHLLVTCPK